METKFLESIALNGKNYRYIRVDSDNPIECISYSKYIQIDLNDNNLKVLSNLYNHDKDMISDILIEYKNADKLIVMAIQTSNVHFSTAIILESKGEIIKYHFSTLGTYYNSVKEILNYHDIEYKEDISFKLLENDEYYIIKSHLFIPNSAYGTGFYLGDTEVLFGETYIIPYIEDKEKILKGFDDISMFPIKKIEVKFENTTNMLGYCCDVNYILESGEYLTYGMLYLKDETNTTDIRDYIKYMENFEYNYQVYKAIQVNKEFDFQKNRFRRRLSEKKEQIYKLAMSHLDDYDVYLNKEKRDWEEHYGNLQGLGVLPYLFTKNKH